MNIIFHVKAMVFILFLPCNTSEDLPMKESELKLLIKENNHLVGQAVEYETQTWIFEGFVPKKIIKDTWILRAKLFFPPSMSYEVPFSNDTKLQFRIVKKDAA